MIIDTGAPEQTGSLFSTLTAWLDGIKDSLPADHTENDLDAATHRQMLADLYGYKSAVWLRRYFYARASILRDMSERNPQLADDLATQFVEQLSVLT